MSSIVRREVKRRKGSKHDKTGCLTCRYRRKKCTDNSFPICGACLRLNLECIREPVRNIVPRPGPESRQMSELAPKASHHTTASPIPCLFQPVLAHGTIEPSQRRHVMRYYITVLTSFLTVSEHFNSFVSAFLPMAMESAALSDALLALASGHLSLVNESYKMMALEARSHAIRSLVAAIKTASTCFTWCETNAAASLAFILYEVGVGNHTGWYTHLKGTGHLIMTATARTASGEVLNGPDALKHSAEGQWVLRNFAYHDIIGSVTLRKRPLIEPDYLKDLEQVMDTCMGVGTEILGFVAKILCLDDDTKPDDNLANNEQHERQALFHRSCADLERQLLEWRCHTDTAQGIAAIAYAWRSAALIVLYRLVRSRLDNNKTTISEETPSPARARTIVLGKIHRQVCDVVEHVGDIPVGEAPESSFLFPLFMAGGEATEACHFEIIRSRLKLSLVKRSFRNLQRGLEVLEDLWDLRQSQPGIAADWTQILDASGEGLSLT